MTKTLERDIETIKRPILNYGLGDLHYKKTWEQFDHLSHKLRLLWKTKKSVLQIMKEERAK